MPRSTFVGFRCLQKQARQQTSSSIWPIVYRRQVAAQLKRDFPPVFPAVVNNADTWRLVRGQKNARFVSSGLGLRIKGSEGLRCRNRPSVLKTLHVAHAPCYHSPPQLLAAPVFLAPLLAFFKSSFIFKAGAAVVAFIKTSFVAKGLAAAVAFIKTCFLGKGFAALVAYFKSGTVFKAITAVSRVSLAIIASLRLQGRRFLRWWHGREHYEKIKRQHKAAGRTKFYPHFRRTTMVILMLPVAFLSIAILASFERTPVWGRWRVIMMSADEETRLVEEFLKPGTSSGSHLDTTTSLDWLAILRASCGEEAGPPGTLMGCPVLDPNVDWRVRWVTNVFAQLGDGVRHVNLTSEHAKDGYNVVDIGATRFAIPPVEYPLTVRPASLGHHGQSEEEHVEGPLITRYACLVVESPICNAFSLGFGPGLQTDPNRKEEAPGVVVVFTGLLDEILRENEGSQRSETQPQKPTAAASSALFGVFQQAIAASPQNPNVPVMPTKHQTDQLASTLAHELSHLLLSHSLETWASNNMYESIGAFFTDLIRTMLYPLTAFLGPVFNDWFGEQIRINSALGLRITSSCASRAAEIEADLLGLRILLGSGIDPRVALEDWATGGLFDRVDERNNNQDRADSDENDDGNWLERTGFGRSHPMNEERHRRIQEELAKWVELGKVVPEGGPEGKKVIEEAERRPLPVPKGTPRTANASPSTS